VGVGVEWHSAVYNDDMKAFVIHPPMGTQLPSKASMHQYSIEYKEPRAILKHLELSNDVPIEKLEINIIASNAHRLRLDTTNERRIQWRVQNSGAYRQIGDLVFVVEDAFHNSVMVPPTPPVVELLDGTITVSSLNGPLSGNSIHLVPCIKSSIDLRCSAVVNSVISSAAW
jgi:hypothetical protein